MKNLYNVLDLLAILPLPFRIAYGVQTPTVSDNLVVHSLLYCFVPVVRQLKLIRKFQKLQLLLPLGSADKLRCTCGCLVMCLSCSDYCETSKAGLLFSY